MRSRTASPGITVAHVSPYAANQPSGINRMIDYLSQQASRQGVRTVLVRPAGDRQHDLDDPHAVRIPIPVGRNWVLAFRAGARLLGLRRAVDVIHTHQIHPLSLLALVAARTTGKPGILTLHVRVPIAGFLRGVSERAMATMCLALCDKVVCVSDAVRKSLSAHRGSVIPNGVPVGRERAPGPAGDFELVFSGRVTESKGIYTLLDAIAMAARRVPDIRLWTYGPVDDVAAYERRKAELGIEAKVSDQGFQAGWTESIHPGQVFVLPSFYEGMPLALLEAMGCGLPAIAAAVGGIPEVLEDGKNGLIVPTGDAAKLAQAIVWAAEHPAERFSMGQAARQRVAQSFTASAMAAAYLSLYRKVLHP